MAAQTETTMTRTAVTSPPQITILSATGQACVLRLFVGKEVKYVTVPPETLPRGWDKDKNLGSLLPAIPTDGDRLYRLQHTDGTRCAVFPRGDLGPQSWQGVDITGLPADFVVDYASLERVRGLNEGRAAGHDDDPLYDDRSCVVRHLTLPDRLLVRRIVPFPQGLFKWPGRDPTVMMAREIRAHLRAAEHGLAPRVVGLVTEPGRGAVGFLSEFVRGAVTVQEYHDAMTQAGQALPETVGRAILAAIRRMHDLGILHHNLEPENMLITPDGQVLITNFEYATWMDGDGHPVDGEGNAVKYPNRLTRDVEFTDYIKYTNLNETQMDSAVSIAFK